MGNRNLSKLGMLVVIALLIALPLPNYASSALADDSSDAYIKVAVLNSTAMPPYAYGGINNDFENAVDLLDRDPYILAQAVNNTEIQAGVLDDYAVLFLIDNWPENESNSMVKDFWKNGGGIVALDSSICTLCYLGILPNASAGDNGEGTYWTYDCYGEDDGIEIYMDHPVTKGYRVGEILWPDQYTFDDAGYHEDWIQGEPEWNAMNKVAVLATDSNISAVSVYQPSVEGRVVHIWNDNVTDSTTKSLILNAVRWAGKASLEDQIATLEAEIADLKTRINDLETNLSTVNSTLTAQIESLEDQIATLETEIADLETRIDDSETDLNTVTTKNEDLEDKLNTTTIISYGGIGVGIIGVAIAVVAIMLSRKKHAP